MLCLSLCNLLCLIILSVLIFGSFLIYIKLTANNIIIITT